MMELRQKAFYHGPNPLSRDAVAVIELHIPEPGVDGLLQSIRALQSQTADWLVPREPHTDMPPRVRIGSFLADWALQAQTFSRGFLHAAGCAPDPDSGGSLIWVGFHDPQIAWEAVCLASRWLTQLARKDTDTDFTQLIDQLWVRCSERHPDYQARIVMEACRKRDVPYGPAWGTSRFWRYGEGCRSRVLFESSSCDDGFFGTKITQSKEWTKSVLRALGMPVPAFRMVTQESEVDAAVEAIGFPCVTKPIDRGGGKGVTAGLTDLDAARAGFAAAREYSLAAIMVERHVDGDDHRLMVAEGRFAAAIRRERPVVVGDGIRTIAELVDLKNAGRDPRSLVRSAYLRPIRLDASAQLHLRGLGLTPESVLAPGRAVHVRSNANLSGGGTCVDVTEQVHPALRAMAETIARTLNVAAMGADYITTDISEDPAVTGGKFNEINAVPALDTMVVAGWPVDRVGDLALGTTAGRIPTRLLIVDDDALGRTTDAARARSWPSGCGCAAWDTAVHGEVTLLPDDSGPWGGVRTLMGHRDLSRAVIIASDRQVVEHGLPLDRVTSAHLACTLPEEWFRVVRTYCDRVEIHQPPDAAQDWPQMLVAALL